MSRCFIYLFISLSLSLSMFFFVHASHEGTLLQSGTKFPKTEFTRAISNRLRIFEQDGVTFIASVKDEAPLNKPKVCRCWLALTNERLQLDRKDVKLWCNSDDFYITIKAIHERLGHRKPAIMMQEV
jgi:hypothetical protein